MDRAPAGPRAPTGNHKVVELGDVCAALCSAEQLTPYSAGSRGTRHGLCVVVTVVVTAEKRRWSSVLPRERQGPNGLD